MNLRNSLLPPHRVHASMPHVYFFPYAVRLDNGKLKINNNPSPLQTGVPSLSRSPVHQLQSTLRSEEHTSELQSRFDLVCRLLLEKKKQIILVQLNISINTYLTL